MSKSTTRPCNIEWIRSIIAQCKAADVPCFVKQVGARPIYDRGHQIWMVNHGLVDSGKRLDSKGGDMAEWPEDLRVRQFPAIGEMVLPKLGSMLDGAEMPKLLPGS